MIKSYVVSISVKGVTKLYGEQKALDDVSFEINSGEIVGFLGPNGAGKSTMMKIITCFIPQSAGEVKVCGIDVVTDSMNVRKSVGYLPEHNPLYHDMYVKEYLGFIAGLHKVKNKKSRISEMIELVGLTREQHKKIGQLSKGYRQRVGLAQAMIHNPDVLILDEPTSGLDPNQLVEIRALIQQLGKEKTVMLSTHIMQEVEAICDRVMILNRGKLVANNTSQGIQQSTSKKELVKVEFDQEINLSEIEKIDGVLTVKRLDGKVCLVESQTDIRRRIAEFAKSKDVLVLGMQIQEQSLEEAFKQLTRPT